MKDLAVIVVVAVLAASGGVMASMWLLSGDEPMTAAGSTDTDALESLRDRVQVLEEQLDGLDLEDDSVAAVRAAAEAEAMSRMSPAQPPQSSGPGSVPTATSVRESRLDRAVRRREQTRSQLLQAGWTQVEIDEVNRLRDAAALDMLEQSHLRQREMMEKYPEMAGWRSIRDPLRQSMSEEKYVSYLEATGRPTSARIGNLLPGSPGAAAGLQEGDRIIRYGDQRVFGGGDLEYATMQGSYGEPVVVEVERDGAAFTLTLPRGPIGISSFRFRN